MSLDEKAEKWLKNYKRKYPWLNDMMEKYGLDLSLYDLNEEYANAFPSDILNRAHFIEDTCILKTFDEYVKERLPQNFSNVLEVGTGNWTYVSALATFFRKYNNQVPIIGIDRDPYYVDKSTESIQNRNVKGVEAVSADITCWLGEYDVVVNLCSNLTKIGDVFSLRGTQLATDFFYNMWENVSEDGLFVMGLTHQKPSEENMKTFLTPFFKDIAINENKYPTDKSTYPIVYLITAKPKLPLEIGINQNTHQS